MKCTNCGYEIPDESKYCKHCGSPIKMQDTIVSSSEKKCSNCGAPIKDGFSFCDQCGSPVEEAEKDDDNYYKKSKKKKNKKRNQGAPKAGIIIAILLFIVALAGAGFFVYKTKMGSNQSNSNESADKETVAEASDKSPSSKESALEAATSQETMRDDSSNTAPTTQQTVTDESSNTAPTTQQTATDESSNTAPTTQQTVTDESSNTAPTTQQTVTDGSSNTIITETEVNTITAQTSVGDYVYYGTYEQNNNSIDGKEEIEWLVLDEEDDRYLLITSKVIDCLCYNDVWRETAWNDCSLRNWLNTSFLTKAFSERQVDNIIYSEHTDRHGNNSTDRVFIMNSEELQDYFDSNDSRTTGATPYAEAQGVYVYSNGNCWWWVSDAGADQHYARYANCEGAILEYGMLVFNNSFGVRPAIWVNKP